MKDDERPDSEEQFGDSNEIPEQEDVTGATGRTEPIVFPSDAERKKWRRKVVLGVSAAGALIWALYIAVFLPGNSTELQIKWNEFWVNMDCPMLLNRDVSFDKMQILSPLRWQFDFTMLHSVKDNSVDTFAAKMYYKPVIIQLMKRKWSFYYYSNVNIICRLKDRSGQYMYQFTVRHGEVLSQDDVQGGGTYKDYIDKSEPVPTFAFNASKDEITLNLIDTLIRYKKYPTAIYCIDKILTADTNAGMLYYKKASCYAAMQMFDSANANCLRSLGLGYKKSFSYNYVAATYANKGNYQKAILYLDSSLQLDPKNTYTQNAIRRNLGKMTGKNSDKLPM